MTSPVHQYEYTSARRIGIATAETALSLSNCGKVG